MKHVLHKDYRTQIASEENEWNEKPAWDEEVVGGDGQLDPLASLPTQPTPHSHLQKHANLV